MTQVQPPIAGDSEGLPSPERMRHALEAVVRRATNSGGNWYGDVAADALKPAPIASDAAGGLREQINAALRAADAEFGGLSDYRYRVLTDAILALSAPPVHADDADQILATAHMMAKRMGAVFVEDPAKVEAFRNPKPEGLRS